MSSELSSKTVAELKQLLKENGLSVDGKKAELVQRLQEYQEKSTQAPVIQEQQPTATEQVEPEQQQLENQEDVKSTAEEGEQTTEGEKAAEGEESTLTVIQPKQEPKQISPEERKQLAISLLETKIKRAEKFGDEQAANDAKKDLRRVEKFGVELGTALAREIGLVDKSLPRRSNNRHNRHFKRGFKKSNRKGK